MHHSIRIMGLEHPANLGNITDVDAFEGISVVRENFVQAFRACGVGQLVDIYDMVA
jgi:hypothetical protein